MKRAVVVLSNCEEQRSSCIRLPQKTKKNYSQNLNLSDNRKFWEKVKSYFSNKGLNSIKSKLFKAKYYLMKKISYLRQKTTIFCYEQLFHQ